ncbi:inositol monophosphatase family protein [Candidatus Poriferisocius sp.]|uniref:inositol monophosphatase family protein n=1 Tax=Candidatus Poriferisocius sp. TaxID=3101276 RepID=UPI003B02CCAA
MDGDRILAVFDRAAARVAEAVARIDGGQLTGNREGQYSFDVAADEAAREVLAEAGFGVYSEESGLHDADRELVVVLDPVDGSTNAARGLPWYSTSFCAVDSDGLRAALVLNLANGKAYRAVRGRGATVDGRPLAPPLDDDPHRGSGPSGQESLGAATVGLTYIPPRHLGWRQYRVLGSIALDMTAVAEGVLDAYIDCTNEGHSTWDYLGAALVCAEAGVAMGEAWGRELLPIDLAERRYPVAAATLPLLDEVLAQRRTFGADDPAAIGAGEAAEHH